MPQIHTSRLARSFAALVSVGSLAFGLSLPVAAQTASDIDPLEGLGTQDSPDGVFSGGEAGIGDAMDFFHRFNLSNGTTMEQYQLRQQERMGDAATEFFRLREERLNGGSSDAAVDPTGNEDAVSPAE